jgi:hypothetical protein
LTWIQIADGYPDPGEVVWVLDRFYDDVTAGYYDGYCMRTLPSRSDDCHVTHWMPMLRPDPPPEVPVD